LGTFPAPPVCGYQALSKSDNAVNNNIAQLHRDNFKTPYELVDLATSVDSRMDIQISIFITVHLAIYGGIIYVDRPLLIQEKIGSLIIYTIFAILNFHIMQNQLDLFVSISMEIAKLASGDCCSDNELVQMMTTDYENGRHRINAVMMWVVHLAFYFLVVVSVIPDRALSKKTFTAAKGLI
jgi:hypothetical protein